MTRQKESLSTLNKFSTDADNCSLWQFKKVQDTNNVKYLYILTDYSELPESEEGLTDAWFNIYSEWSNIIGGSRADLTILKHRRSIAMKQMFNVHTIMLNAIETLPIQELIDLFNEEGYRVSLDDYENSIKAARSKLNKKKAQIELDEKNEDKGKKEDFDSLISLVERFQGYGFNQKEMSVKLFAHIYKNYKEDGKRREVNKK